MQAASHDCIDDLNELADRLLKTGQIAAKDFQTLKGCAVQFQNMQQAMDEARRLLSARQSAMLDCAQRLRDAACA